MLEFLKKTALALTAGSLCLAAASAGAQNVDSRMGVVVPTDTRESEFIPKTVSYRSLPQRESAALGVDTESMNGTRSGNKISAYSDKPVKYFYYVLDLDPKKSENQQYIIKQRNSEVSEAYCPKDASALLTAYRGDGTKDTFCIRWREQQ